MVRSAAYRASKYSAKIVGDVIKNRIDAQRDSMVEQETAIFGDLVAIEEATKALLTGWGVNVTLVPFYLAFARQCYKITRKHSGDIAHDEICIRHDDWVARLLTSWYLQTIAMDVFTVDISDCT